jgi:glycosyltransferase involved in cell wall biosynthesis
MLMDQLCLISTFPPDVCGIATYAEYLAEGLRAHDPVLRVSVLSEKSDSLSSSQTVFTRRVFERDGDYVGDLTRAVRDLSPDVVHVQHEFGIFGMDDRFPRLVESIRRIGIPVVVTLHTVHTKLSIDLGCAWRSPRQPLPDFDVESYLRRIGEAASHVIVHQDASIRDVLVRIGLSPDLVTVIPHGTVLEEPRDPMLARDLLGLGRDAILLVGFGFFEESKNYYRLIEAVGELIRDEPAVHLWLGGFVRSPVPKTLRYLEDCKALVQRLGMNGHVTWEDRHLSEERLRTLLAAADVVCFPYAEDTRASSGALHRAIGAGKAVLASRIPKFDEVRAISDELLVNPESPSEMARLLRRLIADDAFRASIQWRVLAFARSTSWQDVGARHLQLYGAVRSAHRDSVAPRPASQSPRARTPGVAFPPGIQ